MSESITIADFIRSARALSAWVREFKIVPAETEFRPTIQLPPSESSVAIHGPRCRGCQGYRAHMMFTVMSNTGLGGKTFFHDLFFNERLAGEFIKALGECADQSFPVNLTLGIEPWTDPHTMHIQINRPQFDKLRRDAARWDLVPS